MQDLIFKWLQWESNEFLLFNAFCCLMKFPNPAVNFRVQVFKYIVGFLSQKLTEKEMETQRGKSCVLYLGRMKPYLLMVALRFGSAGMYIVSKATLNHGMSRFVLIVYRNAVVAVTLAPFALRLERLINNLLHIIGINISLNQISVSTGVIQTMLDWWNAFLPQEREATVEILNFLEDHGTRLPGVMLCVKYITEYIVFLILNLNW